VVPVYEGVTQLDFTGPHQFLSRTPDLHVRVASQGGRSITVDNLTFSHLDDLAAIDSCDVLLVPGGGGCIAAIENELFMQKIVRLGATARYLTSVCSGSLILGAAGFLTGRRAACHWAWRELLPIFGAIVDEGRIVRDGNYLSGGGVTAGIDFVLALIAELRGQRVAEMVQLGLEYAPQPPFNSGRPETAAAEVLEALNVRTGRDRAWILPAHRDTVGHCQIERRYSFACPLGKIEDRPATTPLLLRVPEPKTDFARLAGLYQAVAHLYQYARIPGCIP